MQLSPEERQERVRPWRECGAAGEGASTAAASETPEGPAAEKYIDQLQFRSNCFDRL